MHSSKVLEMATKNGARAMGINAGVLVSGRLADIIIVEIKKPQFASMDINSALVHGAGGCDVRTTIVGGKLLMEDHRVELDEAKIIEDARDAMKNWYQKINSP
jgi:5-methylthioadenosine/S-adenosylhomocysteine deaminase